MSEKKRRESGIIDGMDQSNLFPHCVLYMCWNKMRPERRVLTTVAASRVAATSLQLIIHLRLNKRCIICFTSRGIQASVSDLHPCLKWIRIQIQAPGFLNFSLFVFDTVIVKTFGPTEISHETAFEINLLEMCQRLWWIRISLLTPTFSLFTALSHLLVQNLLFQLRDKVSISEGARENAKGKQMVWIKKWMSWRKGRE